MNDFVSPLPQPSGATCPSCGAAQSADATYCAHCGAAMPNKKSAVKTPFWKGVLITFLGLGALAFGAFGGCVVLLTVTNIMNGSILWQGLIALAIAYGLWWYIEKINRS